MLKQDEKTYKDRIKTFLNNSASHSSFVVTVVDILHISGILVNKRNTEYVKLAMNLAMMIATRSGAACLIAGVLETAGCPVTVAKNIAHAASFIVSASGNLTPIGIATTTVSTMVHYAASKAASKFGVWAKSRVSEGVERKRVESLNSPVLENVAKNDALENGGNSPDNLIP